jgi:hypothetical protein
MSQTLDLLAESRDRSAVAATRTQAAQDGYDSDPRYISQATLPPPRDPDPLTFGHWYDLPEVAHRGFGGIETCRECGVQWKLVTGGTCWVCGTGEPAVAA